MKTYIYFFILSTFAVSCIDDPINTQQPPLKDTSLIAHGVYVLNQGLINMNNTSLTYYAYSDSIARTDYFHQVNKMKLGDTGNDMAVYGNRLYIVVCVSSKVMVLSLDSGKLIGQVPLFKDNTPLQPRKIAFYKNKALVCSFDGSVAIIDTASLAVEKFVRVGRNPDGMAVANDKAYVSNSGGLNSPNYDNTVSVIDLKSYTEIKRIEVVKNPYSIVPDKYGDLYVISRGDYDQTKMCLQIIDSKTDTLKYIFKDFEALDLAIKGDTAYVYHYDFNSGSESNILLLNVKNEMILQRNFISDGTVIQTAFGIAVDSITSNVFVGDARGFVNSGIVYCFDSKGKKKFSFNTGLNPGNIVFYNRKKVD